MKCYFYCPKYRKITEAMKIITLNIYSLDDALEYTDMKPWENIEIFKNTKVYFYDAVDMFPEVHQYIFSPDSLLNPMSDDIDKIDFSKLMDRCILLKNNNIEVVFERGRQCSVEFNNEIVDLIFQEMNKSQEFMIPPSLYQKVFQHSIHQYLLEKRKLAAYSFTRRIASNLNETHMGTKKGQKITTKKSIAMKKKIMELSSDFNGDMKDKELMQELHIARNTYYKYKRELHKEKNEGRQK